MESGAPFGCLFSSISVIRCVKVFMTLVFARLIKQQGVLFHIDLIHVAVIMLFVQPANSLSSTTTPGDLEFNKPES